MKSKQLSGAPHNSKWIFVFEPGEEPIAVLTAFCNEHHIFGGHLSGIGGFSEVTLAYFNLQTRQYEPIPIREQVEVMSLAGNIAQFENKAKLHVHAVIGKRDGRAHGGHLLDARVQPTLEVFVVESPTELRREKDSATGLPLLKI
jgi:predicted DNA-binding protein with PD1-like motif